MLTLAVLGVPLYLAKKRRRDLQTVRNSGNNICHPAPNQRPSISWAALADAGIRVSGDHATSPPIRIASSFGLSPSAKTKKARKVFSTVNRVRGIKFL